MKWKSYLLGLLGLFFLLGFDQLTKYLAVMQLKEKTAFPIIKNTFELQYLENHGAAFGMMQNQRIPLLCFTAVILVLLIAFYLKLPFTRHYLPLRFVGILIAAGAVGNMIDRLRLSYVIDFLYFKLIDFPVFNLADCYVVVAAFFGFFLVCFYYKDEDFAFIKKQKQQG